MTAPDPDWDAVAQDLAANGPHLVAMVQAVLRRARVIASHDEAQDLVMDAAAELVDRARRTGIPADGPQLTVLARQRATDRARREATLARVYGHRDDDPDGPALEGLAQDAPAVDDQVADALVLAQVRRADPPLRALVTELATSGRLTAPAWEAVRDLRRHGRPPADAATRQRRKRALDRIAATATPWLDQVVGDRVELRPETTLALLEVTGVIHLRHDQLS